MKLCTMGFAPRVELAQACGQLSISLCSPCLETVSFFKMLLFMLFTCLDQHLKRVVMVVEVGGFFQWVRVALGWIQLSILRETRILILRKMYSNWLKKTNINKKIKYYLNLQHTQIITYEALTLNSWTCYQLRKIRVDKDNCRLKQWPHCNTNKLITC